jgi:hypothetical protein
MKSRDLVLIFIVCRLILLVSLSSDGLRGFGDFVHFYNLAGMGLPMINYWVEFPPVFPYLSLLLFNLAGGKQHLYDYLLAGILTLAQAGSLGVFIYLVRKLYPDQFLANQRIWAYFAIILALPYGWWYFDPLAVFALLLGLAWLIERKVWQPGLVLAIGVLTKLFPIMALPLAWRWLLRRSAIWLIGIVLGITLGVYAGFLLASPQMTLASLRSQAEKGSWETVWALIDGNLDTGNFGPEIERLDASTSQIPRGNPSRISSWITLIPFALLGGWLFWKARLPSPRSVIAFLGLTWCLFLLWTPGYSPQWILYLLPLVFLALPGREANLFAITLVIVNVLEWPVMLTRGYNWGLWLTIPIRTLLFVMLAIENWKVIADSQKTEEAC